MSNVYIDSKDDHKKDVEVESEEKVETEEKVEYEEKVEDEKDTCDCEQEDKSSETKSDKEFKYRAYGKETVEETRNMAEKMFNDVVATLKSKQNDWNKTLEEYKSNKPSVDLLEYDDNLVIKVDLPRVSKDNIDIKMSTESVDIEVDFPDELEGNDEVKVLRKERCTGKTKNVVLLPVEVDIQEVKASFEDYVLTITLPKIKGKKVDVEIL